MKEKQASITRERNSNGQFMSIYHLDKDHLKNAYSVDKKSTTEIANEYNVSPSTIQRKLRDMRIPLRQRKRNPLDGKWLYEQYVILDKSSWQIADETNMAHQSILYDLNRLGIEIRNKSSALKKYREKVDLSGINAPNWKGGISYEPYCPKFNEDYKEKIRNRDNRTCALCGKSEIENGRKLSVHHVDGEKMQGCDGIKWHLISLCKHCHKNSYDVKEEFLLNIIAGEKYERR